MYVVVDDDDDVGRDGPQSFNFRLSLFGDVDQGDDGSAEAQSGGAPDGPALAPSNYCCKHRGAPDESNKCCVCSELQG